MLENILEYYVDESFLKADGFDETQMRLIYSVTKCIEILRRDMSCQDAMEHFNFNVNGSYMGEKTPIWCFDNFD